MPQNHNYRVVFNQSLGTWVAVPETARARGKGGRSAAVLSAVSLLLGGRSLATAALTLSAVMAHAGPVGGEVTSGSARISQAGATTSVTQTTPNVSLNWQGFNTSAGETVNFIQPSASAIAVNRVLGTAGTEFFGRMNANGQVYLINPNGILFGASAQVNVGGLVASTLDLGDASLASSTRTFSAAGTGRVVNEGSLQGRYVALLGSSVSNRGSIAAPGGAVALGAGSTVTLTFAGNDLVKLNVDRSTVETLAENGGLIQADGGRVFLSAGAKDTLLASVVNNTGLIEARTVENREGTIVLLGGMTGPGQVNVGGTLDASAPSGGNGGFIETSAAHVSVSDTAHVTTLAAAGGRHGTWLVDPVDFTIAAQGGDISGATLGTQLAGGNVTILSTQGTAGVDGDIHVNDAVSWSAGTTLELSALRNININKSITATGDGAGLTLTPNNTGAGGGDYVIGRDATVTLSGNAPTLTIGGSAYTVINNSAGAGTGATALQNVSVNLAGRYALGEDIDLVSLPNFSSIGPTFTGTLTGMGHSVDHLTITSGTSGYAGLIASNSGTVRDLSLVNVAVNPGATASYTGALVGYNAGTIRNVDVSGTVAASSSYVGGLAGYNAGALKQSGADVQVTSSGGYTGGLVGGNSGALTDVYATGAVSGTSYTGGLVGYHTGSMTRAYASGAVTGGYYVGGLAGYTDDYALLSQVYAAGSVSGSYYVGGLVGYNLGSINEAYASGAVSGISYVGGLVGQNGNYYYSSGYCDRYGCYGGYSYYYPGYVSNAYWDTQTTGQAVSVGYNYYGSVQATGLTSAQALNQTSYSGWNFAGAWTMYDGLTRPLLRSFMTPLTVTAIDASKTYDGQAYSGGNGVAYSVQPDANLLGTVNYSGTSQGAVNAGSYGITPGGLYSNQQGYLITYASGALTVNAAPITVSTSNVSKTYDGTTSALGTTVVTSGALYGTDSLSGGSYAFTDKNAGIGNKTVTVSGVAVSDGNGGGNYVVSYADNTSSTIDPATLTATMTAAGKVYDGSTSAAPTFTITGGLVGTETVTASGVASFADKNAGTAKTVTATSVTLGDGTNGGLGSNYTLAAGQTALADITPKAVSVSGITAADKTYDGTTAATVSTAGAIVNGLVAGDAVTLGATGTFSDKNVGPAKTVTLASSYGGADVGNYAITDQASTTASITPATLSVSGITAADKVYDGNTVAAVSTGGAVLTGLVAGDAVSVGATGTFSDKNVGPAKTVTLASSYGGADVGNYAITDQASTTASITPKAVSVSGITAADKTYDGTTAATVSTAGAIVNGLVAGDAVTLGASGTFSDKNVGTAKTVTLSSSYGGADVGNYAITDQASTTASITPATLSVSGITAADKVYDGNTVAAVSTGAAVLSGLVAGDAVSVGATGTFSDKNVGPAKTVALSSSYGGADVGNYAITDQASTTASITPKAVSVSGITAADKTYDGTTAATVSTAGAIVNGLVAGDAVTVGTTGTFSDKNVGTAKTVTLSSSYGGADVGNYAITDQASTTASITPKAVSVSGITAADKTYDGTAAATVSTAGAVVNGLVAGDAVTLGATGTFSDKNVGSDKTVTLASSYDGADVGNYAITDQASTTASITPKSLVVSANADSKVADGRPYGGGNGVTYSGFVAGDTVAVMNGSLAYGGASQGTTRVGSYAIAPSGLGAANYTLRFVDGVLTILDAPLPTQSLAGAVTLTQSLLQDVPPDQPATLRLLNCTGKGIAAADVTCSSPGSNDPAAARADASRPTLRIVNGGIRLPQDTNGSNK